MADRLPRLLLMLALLPAGCKSRGLGPPSPKDDADPAATLDGLDTDLDLLESEMLGAAGDQDGAGAAPALRLADQPASGDPAPGLQGLAARLEKLAGSPAVADKDRARKAARELATLARLAPSLPPAQLARAQGDRQRVQGLLASGEAVAALGAPAALLAGLQGIWTGPCAKDPEGDAYLVDRLIVTGDTYNSDVLTYLSAGCPAPAAELERVTARLTDAGGSPAATHFDAVVVSISTTPLVKETADGLNEERYCGFRDWLPNVQKTLTGKRCSGAQMERAGTSRLETYTVTAGAGSGRHLHVDPDNYDLDFIGI